MQNSNSDHGAVNWLRLASSKQPEAAVSTRVHTALAQAGIHLPEEHLAYIASIMFGEHLDDLDCGYCGHPADQHIWGIDADPTGNCRVNHFNCRQCAQEKDTPLVVCYTRPGGGTLRDAY